MSGVVFVEGKGLPREFTRGGGYQGYRMGDATFTEAGGAAIMGAVSPWNFLTQLFVTKPAQEHAAQVAIAQAQADAQGQALYARSANLKTILMYGAGGVGALALILYLTRRRSSPVAGYRSRRRRRNRR